MSKNNVITENELFLDMQSGNPISTNEFSFLQRLDGMPLQKMIAEIEREIISHTLEKHRGNVATTAQQLQIGKTAFYNKMKRYGITPKNLK
jgi:DNA-binding NtrC family response regulator